MNVIFPSGAGVALIALTLAACGTTSNPPSADAMAAELVPEGAEPVAVMTTRDNGCFRVEPLGVTDPQAQAQIICPTVAQPRDPGMAAEAAPD